MFPSRLLPQKSHFKIILRITLPSGSLHHHVTLPQMILFWPPKLRDSSDRLPCYGDDKSDHKPNAHDVKYVTYFILFLYTAALLDV